MAEPGIVTPEAVVLSFETAGVGSRVVAEVIDLAVQGGAGALVAFGGGLLSGTAVGLAVVYFGIFLVAFGYPIGMETLWRGRTLGKAVMGLRVVTVEGGPERFRHALVRGALGLIDFYATSGAAAVLCILATKRNQRLGDLVAGTLVLRERTGGQALSAATFWVPPGWEGYAATLDVNAVTAADYQAIRSFLLRAGSLDPWTARPTGAATSPPPCCPGSTTSHRRGCQPRCSFFAWPPCTRPVSAACRPARSRRSPAHRPPAPPAPGLCPRRRCRHPSRRQHSRRHHPRRPTAGSGRRSERRAAVGWGT